MAKTTPDGLCQLAASRDSLLLNFVFNHTTKLQKVSRLLYFLIKEAFVIQKVLELPARVYLRAGWERVCRSAGDVVGTAAASGTSKI